MSLFFGVGNIVFGALFLLIGFKVYNPFKGKSIPGQEVEWYKKYSIFFKIAGVVLLLGGLVNVAVDL